MYKTKYLIDQQEKYKALKTILFHNKSLLFFTNHVICDKIIIPHKSVLLHDTSKSARKM